MTKNPQGAMLPETFQQRRGELIVFFRCLTAKFGDDRPAQESYCLDQLGISKWSLQSYRRQIGSLTHINGGIPYGLDGNYGSIKLAIEDIVREKGLTSNGKAKATRPPFRKPLTPFPTQEAASPARASAVDADPSSLQIVRSLMLGMDRASLKVVMDHAFELSAK